MDPQSSVVSASATQVLKQLCPKPLEEVGQLLTDEVRYWRFQNQIRILRRAEAYANRKGLKLKPMGLKVLLPLLDGMSLEENPDLQERWARLLMNASAVGTEAAVCRTAREALESFSGNDVRLLDALFQEVNSGTVPADGLAWGTYRGAPKLFVQQEGLGPYRSVARDRLLAETKLSQAEFELSFDCITRFNLIEAPEREDLDGRRLDPHFYAFTRLGWQVINLLSEAPEDRANISKPGV